MAPHCSDGDSMCEVMAETCGKESRWQKRKRRLRRDAVRIAVIESSRLTESCPFLTGASNHEPVSSPWDSIKNILQQLHEEVVMIKASLQCSGNWPTNINLDPSSYCAGQVWDALGFEHGSIGPNMRASTAVLNPDVSVFVPELSIKPINRDTLLQYRHFPVHTDVGSHLLEHTDVRCLQTAEPASLDNSGRDANENINFLGDWRSLPTSRWEVIYKPFVLSSTISDGDGIVDTGIPDATRQICAVRSDGFDFGDIITPTTTGPICTARSDDDGIGDTVTPVKTVPMCTFRSEEDTDENSEIYWTPGSTGIPKVVPEIVDAPRVVSLPLSVWRFKTGLTNLTTECIKRMYDRGIFCPKDNVVYTVAWPRF